MDTTIDRKGIVRVEIKGRWGWQVKLYHGPQQLRKYFSDSGHGGKDNAFQKALVHRDQVAQEIIKAKIAAGEKIRTDRTTRVRGVSRTWIKSRGHAYDCFRTSIQVEGEVRSRSYSVNKYGEEKAFLLACRWRGQQEIERDGKSTVPGSDQLKKMLREQQ